MFVSDSSIFASGLQFNLTRENPPRSHCWNGRDPFEYLSVPSLHFRTIPVNQATSISPAARAPHT